MTQKDELIAAGTVSLSKIELVRSDLKRSLDLTALFLEMDVYEDMFSNTMSATVTIMDTHNLVTEFPIIGEEYLDIEFKTPSFPEEYTIKHRFYVYKLSSKVIGSDNKSVYVLNLMSYDVVSDLNFKISKSFNGTTSEIADQIFSRYIASSQYRNQKNITIEDTSSRVKFVSNYWSPFKCLNYCAAISTNQETFRTPNYLFFETNKSYKFVSADTLMKETPAIKYYYDSSTRRDQKSGGSVRDVLRELQTVSELKINQTFDYVKRMMSGLYSHKVFEADVLRKTIKKHIYNYWYDFDRSNHLEKYPMASKFIEFDDKNGIISTKPIYPMTHNDFDSELASILSKRVPLLSQLDMYSVDVTVPGRTDIEVGKVIYLELGTYSGKDEKNLTQSNEDRYYSGKYLVTAIMHRITSTRHQMKMSLIKDSIREEIKFD